MSERIFYGVCENGCKAPVYTREEVLSILRQAITDGTLSNVDAELAAITALIDGNGGADVKFWTGTEAEFLALDPAPAVSRFIPRRGLDGTVYICIDDSSLSNLPAEPLTDEEIAAICC